MAESFRMKLEDFVRTYKEASLKAQAAVPEAETGRLIEMLAEAREADRQIFVCGNGGSAAMASHMAGELGKDASTGKPRRFRVMSLTDNVAWMTALANDGDYRDIFVEQLRNHARAGDILIAFSTSGNSRNVLEAVRWGKANGVPTVGITGLPGGRLREEADLLIQVQSDHVGRIQEGHFLIQHVVCYFFIEN